MTQEDPTLYQAALIANSLGHRFVSEKVIVSAVKTAYEALTDDEKKRIHLDELIAETRNLVWQLVKN